MSLNRLTYKFESISALTGAGRRYGTDAFAPGSAPFASRTLGDAAVYDNKAYGLLSKIIGRLYAWRCDKPEIRLAMFSETICMVLSWTTVGHIAQCNVEKRVSAFFHRICKIAGSKFFGLVKNVKHLTHRIQQSLAVIGSGLNAFVALLELCFAICDTLNVKLFCSGSHVLSLNHLLQMILSGGRGPPLEKKWGFLLSPPNVLKCREIMKKWVFELGCVTQTRHVGTKIPVNGYNLLRRQ